MALDLSTAVGRLRHALGDVTDPPLHPDGAAWYTSMLTLAGGDEPTAYRAAAAALAAYLQNQPIQIGGGGDRVAFDAARIARLLTMSRGRPPYPFNAAGEIVAPAPAGGPAPLEVTW